MHRVHHFASSAAALSALRDNQVEPQDVLLVADECVVATAGPTPFAVTVEAGSFAVLDDATADENGLVDGVPVDTVVKAVDEAVRHYMPLADPFVPYATLPLRSSGCALAHSFTFDEILLVAEAINHRARRFAEKLAQSPDDHVARSVWIASIAQLETARHKLLEGSFGPGAGEGSPALPA